MQKLGKLLEGVVGKKNSFDIHRRVYDPDDVDSLSVCIDERKIEKVVQKKFDEAQEQVLDGMDMVGKVEFSELVEAISQSNCIVVRKGK